MRFATTLLLALFPALAYAEKWEWQDTALESAYAATLAVDYVQTVQITRDGREVNPIMGRSGEKVPPAVYFPVAFAAHAAAMYFLPRDYRRVVQGMSVGISFLNISRNYSVGYGVFF